MKYAAILTAVAALAQQGLATSVSGTPVGFAASATGGGSAAAVTPTSTTELVSYLGDDEARVIVLTQTFDFTGTEGTTTATGCAPWGTASGCQLAINADDWCDNYESSAPSVSVTYDNAGTLGITVNSNKSLIGVGTSGVIKGKGLRMVSGVSNIIIQNIAVTDINPEYVWGGDAITLDDADLVWIDHVTTARIGRQHYVLGTSADNRVSITNNYIDGESEYSATCDNHHYWNVYLDGSSDKVTFSGNYLYKTSGRAPKVQDNTYLHIYNNYWNDNSGHAFEIGSGGYVLAEGNYFEDVDTVLETDSFEGALFSSDSASSTCSSYIGRSCVANTNGGDLTGTSTTVLSDLADDSLPTPSAASTDPATSAGQGNL
ncbi:polysaccharide lyase family 1 protein [Aspergillus saccharolyticus JOP 1030-1]|uniref:pectin lyase n=1 Tax=Aspergillus saccharolyticus JOP 1030-1 TaxID=1450539 RepID=A0A318Z7L4_9EURO|nr:pectin lyase pelD [Aspergillus saccharolyticus JOP 1030-1]PYH42424.1 pectin lyase pelD [Aspergillus saccharolyticus JOP 1030-1]